LIGRNDYANGFNSMSRQKMLNAHAQMFPEATAVFNFFYGAPAPVFVFDTNGELLQLSSEEGSRQGCSAGTEAFCLSLHKVLLQLQERYPEYEFRVLTDDIIPMVPPPASPTFSAWQECYRRYAAFLVDLRKLSADLAGLSLNADKAGLLLPPFAPQPTPEVRALFDKSFQFRVDGFRVAGAPIGTNTFLNSFVLEKVTEATSKVEAIRAVGKSNARAAHRLLFTCATKLLNFLASTVPPDITLTHLRTFDATVQNAFWDALKFTSDDCSEARFCRAELKVCLPAPKGCGLFKVADFAGGTQFLNALRISYCLVCVLGSEHLLHLPLILSLMRLVGPRPNTWPRFGDLFQLMPLHYSMVRSTRL
jgi:hypothetical protein